MSGIFVSQDTIQIYFRKESSIMKYCKRILCVGIYFLILSQASANGLKHAVVKIFSFARNPSYLQPWVIGSPYEVSGSGLVLKNGEILTNAHVVANAVFIQVVRSGDPRKYTAHLKYIENDMDLAILTVKNPDFFKGTTHVQFGGVPKQGDKIKAYGFPIGGNQLSITQGIVSRIEILPYVHAQTNLLAIQTDAAINPGNSGGPVFEHHKCIGVSFQSLVAGGTQGIGYIIPVPVIKHFLKNISNKRFGVPVLGVFWEKMESQDIRTYYKIPKRRTGILVTRVIYGSSAWHILKPGDVILSIDHVKIANNGTIPFQSGERLNFSYLITQHQIDDILHLSILRHGKINNVNIRLLSGNPLIPHPQYDVLPTYYIYGGLVFTPLTFDFMDSWQNWKNVPSVFRYLYETQLPSRQQKHIVVLIQVLPNKVNVGYHDVQQAIVKTVNGYPIRGMKSLVQAFQKPEGAFQVIQFSSSDGDMRIVLNARVCQKENAMILKEFGISANSSANLKKIE